MINVKVIWSYTLSELAVLEWSGKKEHSSFEKKTKRIYFVEASKIKADVEQGGREKKQVLELKVILTENKSV